MGRILIVTSKFGVFLKYTRRRRFCSRDGWSNPNLVLRDAFDFFAGTSTGAIIATCLAWGMSVQQIEDLGDLQSSGILSQDRKLFNYVRCNRYFRHDETTELRKATKQQFSLDNLGLIPFLQKAGREYAAGSVRREHFFPLTTGES
jgi:patatin-like phospholipase/acyl hydrolase